MFKNRLADFIKHLSPAVDLSKILRKVDLGDGLAANPVLNTFTERVADICPGFGSPLGNDTVFTQTNVALSGTGQSTTTLPKTSTWTASQTLSAGYVRVKVYGGSGTSPTLTDVVITGSNGTITTELAALHPNSAIALSATSYVELLFPFITDLTLTSISILLTMGGTGPGSTLDCEVAGTAGSSPTQS